VLIGYARVSKTEQNLDLQIDALKAAGCDPRRIFTDKQSGAKWDRRGLDAALSHLREGDTLVVWKMDRLGRTVLQSVQFLNSLHKERIEFRSLTEGIDTNTPMGKFYFHMAAALAELEGREEEIIVGGTGRPGAGHDERRRQVDGTGGETDERVALDHQPSRGTGRWRGQGCCGG
jgi:DNA invertase Pin-like site-specific DNA recombinase